MKAITHIKETNAQYLRLAEEVNMETHGFDFEDVLHKASFMHVASLFTFQYIKSHESLTFKSSAKTNFEKVS